MIMAFFIQIIFVTIFLHLETLVQANKNENFPDLNYEDKKDVNFQSDIFNDKNNLYVEQEPVEVLDPRLFKGENNKNVQYSNENFGLDDYEGQFNKADDQREFFKLSRIRNNNAADIILDKKILSNENSKKKNSCLKSDINNSLPEQLNNGSKQFERQINVSKGLNDNENYEDIYEYTEKINSNYSNKCDDHSNTNSDVFCKKENPQTLLASLEKYSGKISEPKLNQVCKEFEVDNNTNKSKECNNKDIGILTPFHNNVSDSISSRRLSNKCKISNNNKRLNNKKLAVETVKSSDTHEDEAKLQSNHISISHNSNGDEDTNEIDDLEKKVNSKPYIKVNHDHRLQHNVHHLRIRESNIDTIGNQDVDNSPTYQKNENYDTQHVNVHYVNERERNGKNKFTKHKEKHLVADDALKTFKNSNEFLDKRKCNDVEFERSKVTTYYNPLINAYKEDWGKINRANMHVKHKKKSKKKISKVVKENFNTYFEDTGEPECKSSHFIHNNKNAKRNFVKPNAHSTVKNVNNITPLDDANATNLLDSKYDSNSDNDNIQKNKKSVRSKSIVTTNFKQQEFLDSDLESLQHNMSSDGFQRNKNQELDIQSYIPSNDVTYEINDPKKRSILSKHTDFHDSLIEHEPEYDKHDTLKEVSMKVGKEKQPKSNYDYDSNKMDDIAIENNLKENNILRNQLKENKIQTNGETHSNRKLQRKENLHKKKKQAGKKTVHNVDENTVYYTESTIAKESIKYGNIQTEITDSEKREEMSIRASQTVAYATSKRSTESGKIKLREHISQRPIEKQCHPPAGPPKFKWCPEENALVRDQEYEDTLKGKVALRIVEVILAKVHKSSKMTYDFGFCKTSKKAGGDDERLGDIQSSVLKSQDLKEIMAGMDKMSCKSCNQLPPKLKEFLEWLIKVKSVRSVHAKENSFEKQLNCSFGDSDFLFHRYGSLINHKYENNNYNQATCQDFQFATSSCNYDDNLRQDTKFSGENDDLENTLNLMGEPSSNDFLMEEQRQLYNDKIKRYAIEKEFNYPDNYYSDNIVRDHFTFPSSDNFNQNEYPDSNLYTNGDNYNYHLSNKSGFPNDTSEHSENLFAQNINSGNLNSYDNYFNKYSEQNNEEIQDKQRNEYKCKTSQYNYDENAQSRSKRNNEDLLFRDLGSELKPELHFIQVNHKDMDEDLNEMINDRNVDKPKGITINENDQQLGFYTPSVFQFPNDYI